MQNFYNSSKPSANEKNTINSVSINIRDFLLTKNLKPQYPQLSTSINGSSMIGMPVLDTTIGDNAIMVPIGLPLETEGISFKNKNISTNQFKNDVQVADDLQSIELKTKDINKDFPNAIWPQGTQKYPTSSTDEVAKYGLIGKMDEAGYRKKNTIKNLYLDADKQIDISTFIDLAPTDVNQQVKGYLDTYGSLNTGESGAIKAINIIGSVLNGQGLGLAKGGVTTNYDVRASLVGRVLGASGFMNDTKLGTIGGQQLALALANNAAFNVQQDILGSLNIADNAMSLVKDGTLAGFRSDYTITKPSSTGGQIADYTAKILGFTLPKSYLDDAGSIFQTENNSAENIDRANAMALNTGKGQNQALLSNVNANLIGISPSGTDNPSNSTFRVGYAPAYTNNNGEVQITSGVIYAFSNQGKTIPLFGSDDNIIPNLSYNREQKVQASGFEAPEDLTFVGHRSNTAYSDRKISDVSFSWGTEIGGKVNSNADYYPYSGDKKSLLSKTQKLFNSKGMLNIVTAKGDMDKKSTQIQQANGNGFSKGSQVLKGDLYDESGRYNNATGKTADETYCRSWTTLDRYDSVNNLIRKHGLWGSDKVPYRFNTEGSVLEDYGFAKIAPYTTDKAEDPKKFMFSIENLAWADDSAYANLPQVERGPGDLISGKRGRIMWFPPYNINFTENTSVSWDSNNFIGRGEPLYTYNNTERSGTLSFQVIVDHPSYANSFRGVNGPDDNYIASFWAGCVDPNSEMGKKLTPSQVSSLVVESLTVQEPKKITTEPTPDDMIVYFPNDNANIPSTYENGLSGSTTANTINYSVSPTGLGYGLGSYPSNFTPGVTQAWPDRYNFGLNYKGERAPISNVDGVPYYGYFDPRYDQAIVNFLNTKCKYCVVEVTGYASPQGSAPYNQKLANARAKAIRDELRDTKWGPLLTDKRNFDKRFKTMPSIALTNTKCIPNHGEDTDTIWCKLDRKAVIHFRFSPELAAADYAQATPVIKKSTKTVNTLITNKFYDESKFFEQMVSDDAFVFDRVRDKIKYFHPAFHSTTPEGLNSRLTFLQQCTRQGPTSEAQGANNLAFGRPPVCILRIGDFYNTKIIIDNVGIDYEPLVWDMNPEGVGIQPMIANVNLSFKFIGGSTLMGPINKLQNALSFNYYANTQVYDPRADYIAKTNLTVTKKYKKSDGTEVSETRPEYKVSLGQVDISNPETAITPDVIADNTPEINQEAAAEQAVSGTTVQDAQPPAGTSATTQNDIYVYVTGNKTTDAYNGSIDIKLVTPALADSYDMKVSVFDAKNNRVEIGVGKVDKTKPEQSYTYPIALTNNNFVFGTSNNYVIRIDFIGYKSFNITKQF